MTETERWLFIEFLKMECRAEKAEAELEALKAPLKFAVDAETKIRIAHRRTFKNNNTFSRGKNGRN